MSERFFYKKRTSLVFIYYFSFSLHDEQKQLKTMVMKMQKVTPLKGKKKAETPVATMRKRRQKRRPASPSRRPTRVSPCPTSPLTMICRGQA